MHGTPRRCHVTVVAVARSCWHHCCCRGTIIRLVRHSQNSSSNSWVVGQGFFQPFSDSLQPKHGWKALQKQRGTLEKTRKLGEENPLQTKNSWKEPCPATLKMSSGTTSRCRVTVVAVARSCWFSPVFVSTCRVGRWEPTPPDRASGHENVNRISNGQGRARAARECQKRACIEAGRKFMNETAHDVSVCL